MSTTPENKTRKPAVRDGGMDYRFNAEAVAVVVETANESVAQNARLKITLSPKQAFEWLANGLADGSLSVIAAE